jgi:hypothetical protein
MVALSDEFEFPRYRIELQAATLLADYRQTGSLEKTTPDPSPLRSSG